MVIYIATVLGGPEVSGTTVDWLIGKITDLRGDVAAREPDSQEPIEDSGSLEIVFEIPGSLFESDYHGVRTGSLSRTLRLLQVQVAVPTTIHAMDQPGIERFLLGSLREAIRIAALSSRVLGSHTGQRSMNNSSIGSRAPWRPIDP